MNNTTNNMFEQGNQGVVGIVNDNNSSVFKFSRHLSFLGEHEYTVLHDLSQILSFCPHFPKRQKLETCSIRRQWTDSSSIFQNSKGHGYKVDVCFMERVENATLFHDLIESRDLSMEEIYAIVHQVLCAIWIAQRQVQFVHYDLHSSNILIQRCDPNRVHVYHLDDQTTVAVPTLGFHPVIIDMGFSRSQSSNHTALTSTLSHSEHGFLYPLLDSLADYRLFLISLTETLKHYYPHSYEPFRNVVKHLFEPYPVQWNSGWDCSTIPIMDDLCYAIHHTSEFWNRYAFSILDILQYLVDQPIVTDSYSEDDLEEALGTFLDQFEWFEDEIFDSKSLMYLVRSIVLYAKPLRDMYEEEATRAKAVQLFRRDMFQTIREVASFSLCSELNYEVLLCSCFVIQDELPGYIQTKWNELESIKNTMYNQMHIQSMNEMEYILDICLPIPYSFSTSTQLYYYDSVQQQTMECQLDSELQTSLNERKTGRERGAWIRNAMHH